MAQGIATYMEFRDEPGARWRMMDPMRSAMVIAAVVIQPKKDKQTVRVITLREYEGTQKWLEQQ